MEFGRNEVILDEVDFTLPPDSKETIETLKSSMTDEKFEAYVGGTRWGSKSLIGKIYPNKTKDKDFAPLYAQSFNCIEFGATWYSIHPREKIVDYTAQTSVNDDFMFSPKFPQTITHIRRLRNADDATRAFYDCLPGFDNHLGQMLLQLGDNFSPKSLEHLQAYLSSLPITDRISLELRHKEWFSDPQMRAAWLKLFREMKVGTVITDSQGRRDVVHMELTTPVAYIRFVGNALHQTDYTRIDAWVERIKDWRDKGLQSVWFYIHQYNEAHMVDLADYMIVKMNEELNTKIRRPVILKPFELF